MSELIWPGPQSRGCRAAPWLLLLVLAASACPARAAFVYTTLDHPLAGRGGTIAQDVSGTLIVGEYLDAANARHGFTFDGTNWTTLDAPGAAAPRGTSVTGVSNGLISGTYVTPSGQSLGFLYDGSTWTTIQRPPIGAGPNDTVVRGISGDTVVGHTIESFVVRGFQYRAGVFTDIVVPGAVDTLPDDLDAGRVVGSYEDLIGTHGFVLTDNVLSTINHPLGTPLGTSLTGIDGDRIVGNYLRLPDGSSHGFLYEGTTFTPVDFPGATDTTVNGIDGDRIVGSYFDAAESRHAFVAVVPEPAAGIAVFACAVLAGSRRRRRRSAA